MLILPADVEDEAVGRVVDTLTQAIAERGGEVEKVDRWGRRRLAYEIAKRSEGLYVVVQFRADPSSIRELERVLTLADEVVRYKVVARAA